MPRRHGGMFDLKIVVPAAPQTVYAQAQFEHPVIKTFGFDQDPGHFSLCSFVSKSLPNVEYYSDLGKISKCLQRECISRAWDLVFL
jgi:hypothetical protein